MKYKGLVKIGSLSIIAILLVCTYLYKVQLGKTINSESVISERTFLKEYGDFIRKERIITDKTIDSIELLKRTANHFGYHDYVKDISLKKPEMLMDLQRSKQAVLEMYWLLDEFDKELEPEQKFSLRSSIIFNISMKYHPTNFDILQAKKLALVNYDFAKEKKDSTLICTAIKNLSLAFKNISYDSSLYYLNILMQEFPESPWEVERAKLERRYKNHKEELKYMRLSEEKNFKRAPDKYYVSSELGVSLRYNGFCEEAREITLRDYKADKMDKSVLGVINAINMGRLHLKCYDKQEGLRILEKCFDNALRFNSEYHIHETYDVLSKYYADNKHTEEYSLVANKYIEYIKRESLEANLEILIHQRSDKFKRLVDIKNKTRFVSNIFYIGLFVLFAVFGFYVFNYFKSNLSKAISSISSLEDIERQQKGIISKHLAQEESMSHFMDTLLGYIKKIELNTPFPEEWGKIQDLVWKYQNQFGAKSDFKSKISEIHPDFYKKLIHINPKLTQLDLKHCMYMKLNLTINEVSSILGIADKSVRVARHRLKAKLNLKPDDNLTHFIISL